MDKPFTLKVTETKVGIAKLINEANLPAYVLKIILQELYNEVEKVENEEITKYKESDKKCKKSNS